MADDVLFKGIEELMRLLETDEDHGKVMVETIISHLGRFYVSIRSPDGLLCDLQGDMFLNASGETLVEAWTDLNNICRRSVDEYRRTK